MKLNFLQNPQQRIASGKKLPTKALECLLIYGTSEQKLKAVKKIISAAYSLCQHKLTHHVLLSLCKHCSNTDRVELLFALRRHLIDMARSKVAHVVLMELVSTLPKVQQREVAREFIEELEEHVKHFSASKVVTRLLSLPAAREELLEPLEPLLPAMAAHPLGQHVVAAALQCDPDLCERVAEKLADSASLDSLFQWNVNQSAGTAPQEEGAEGEGPKANEKGPTDSTVLCALMSASGTPWKVKKHIVESLRSHWKDVCTKKTHVHLFRISLEKGADVEPDLKVILQNLILSSLEQLIDDRSLVHLVEALIQMAGNQPEIAAKILKAVGPLRDAAVSSTRTLILRALLDHTNGLLESNWDSSVSKPVKQSSTPSGSKANPQAKTSTTAESSWKSIATAAAELAKNPISSPVLQRMYQHGSEQIQSDILQSLSSSSEGADSWIEAFAADSCAAFLLQAIMRHSKGSTIPAREAIVSTVLNPKRFVSLIETSAGTHTAQCAMEVATNDQLVKLVAALLKAKDEYGNVVGVRASALHQHGSFAVSRLLDQLVTRGEAVLEPRRELMAALKPMVFSLALSPWAGKVVLDAVLIHGSPQLQEAIRNVIFLKAENWLSEVPGSFEEAASGTGFKPGAKKVNPVERKTTTPAAPFSAQEGKVAAPPKAKKEKKAVDLDTAYKTSTSFGVRPTRKRVRHQESDAF